MGSVVIGSQRPLGGFAGRPVVPDGGGHGQQPLGDAGIDPAGGAAAVPFQVELAIPRSIVVQHSQAVKAAA
jgi:hypothetical protein